MDLLQAALIFLILLLSIFLSITGIQVFFILRDLKKALDKLNKALNTGEEIIKDIEKPVAAVSDKIVKKITNKEKKKSTGGTQRFYKKVLR